MKDTSSCLKFMQKRFETIEEKQKELRSRFLDLLTARGP